MRLAHLLDGVPDGGNGVEHQAGDSNEGTHHDQTLVVGVVGVVHVAHDWRAGEGGDSLEEKQETEGVGELLGSEQVGEDESSQQDVGGTTKQGKTLPRGERGSPGDTKTEDVDHLAVVGVTHPAGVLCHVGHTLAVSDGGVEDHGQGLGHVGHTLAVSNGGVEDHGQGLALTVHPGQGGEYWLEVVTEGHGEAADDEAGVVEEQPVELLGQGAQDEPGDGVADADQPDEVTALSW